jgi:hypothetical protein
MHGAFIEHDSLRSEAVVACPNTDRPWRLERITGEAEALGQFDPLLLDESLDRESVSERNCRGVRRHSHREEGDQLRVRAPRGGD